MNAPDIRIRELLGGEGRAPWYRRMLSWIAFAIVAVLAVVAWWWSAQHDAAALPRFATEPLTRGDLVVKVTATGTLQPTNKADVGSELSGTVARVLVDFNDRVKKGQVLAELDTSRLADQVSRSRAALAVAQAGLRQQEATVQEATGNLQRLQEVARLSGGKVPSAAELASAQAALARAEAAVASARAAIADATAALSADETSLRKASIRSPLDGIVLSRSVDPGNAVAASLQAVTLFTIAEDLTRMKLEVNIDEADVGLVREGQRSTFNVSAYAQREYPATILRVNYGSTTKDNVVTYLAELAVDNRDLTLRPGMTGTASIVATERHGVLLVPNAALRFSPDAQATTASGGTSIVSKLLPRFPQRQRRAGAEGAVAPGARQVWVLESGRPVAVAVTTGVSDGRLTEVSGDAIHEGMVVITDQLGATK